jgi:thiol:disulfide interchange protein DsbD
MMARPTMIGNTRANAIHKVAFLGLGAVLLAAGPSGAPCETEERGLGQSLQSADAGSGVLSKLRKLAGQPEAEPEFLPPDQAFKLRIEPFDPITLVAHFAPAEGYYLYRDKIAFTVPQGSEGVAVARVELPPGQMKNDPNFGDTEVLYRPFEARVHLQRSAEGPREIRVEARYQGCAEQGLCYPPEKKTFDMVLAALDSGAPSNGGTAAAPGTPGSVSLPLDETSRVAGLFTGGNFWLVVASFFGFGLLLSFTPCVLPMVPILSGIIVGQAQRVTRRQAFALSAAYVAGMALTYAGAGVAAGLSGTLLASTLQNPWVLGSFAAIFVALALSMFGLYELQLPAALQTRLSDASNRMKGGTLCGVFAMGVLSALIVGPCVAAPLAGALIYINQSRDAVLGGSALFAMALGMGVPLMAVGVSAGTLVPRAGPWMRTVKSFFGVLLLGLAIWIVSPVIPAVVHMLLWAGLLIICAIYLHAIDPLPPNASGFRRLWKGIGVIALLLGVALVVGALSGGRDVLQPLSGLRSAGAQPSAGEVDQPQFVLVRTVAELDQRLAQARGRPVMLDFYADWCVSCKEMERFTFPDPRVRSRMDRMLLLKVDVTANTAEDAALLKRFGLFGPPATIFFDRSGNELPYRVIGFQAAERFALSLETALGAG